MSKQLPSPTPTTSPSPSPPPPSTTESDAAEPTPTPEKDPAQPEPVDYFFPDAPPDATTFKNKIFAVRIGFAIFADYTHTFQDSISRTQVVPQASTFYARTNL